MGIVSTPIPKPSRNSVSWQDILLFVGSQLSRLVGSLPSIIRLIRSSMVIVDWFCNSAFVSGGFGNGRAPDGLELSDLARSGIGGNGLLLPLGEGVEYDSSRSWTSSGVTLHPSGSITGVFSKSSSSSYPYSSESYSAQGEPSTDGTGVINSYSKTCGSSLSQLTDVGRRTGLRLGSPSSESYGLDLHEESSDDLVGDKRIGLCKMPVKGGFVGGVDVLWIDSDILDWDSGIRDPPPRSVVLLLALLEMLAIDVRTDPERVNTGVKVGGTWG